MNELDSVIRESTSVPISTRRKAPKKTRARKASPKTMAKAKKQAVEIVDSYLADETSRQTKLARKLNKAEISPRVVHETFATFETAVGGRAALIKILQHCPDNSPAAAGIRALCADPDFLAVADDGETTSYALAVLAQRAKLPFNALIQAFRDATRAELALRALTEVAEVGPVVAKQVAEDAQNRFEDCSLCEGVGRIRRISDGEFVKDPDGDYVTQVCYECKGRGRRFRRHDAQNRKLLLQMTGILEEKPLIAQSFNDNRSVSFNFDPGSGSFERLSAAVDRILTTEPAPIDVEVVEIAPEA